MSKYIFLQRRSKTEKEKADIRFVKNFTSIFSPNFNSFGDKNTQKMSENGNIYTACKKFTLSPAVTAVTNLTSGKRRKSFGEGKCYHSGTTNKRTRKDRTTQPMDCGRLRWAIRNSQKCVGKIFKTNASLSVQGTAGKRKISHLSARLRRNAFSARLKPKYKSAAEN